MEINSVNKCRTCLQTSTTTFALNEFVTEAKTKSTYGQLLQECAGLDYSSEYEHLMPKNLCSLCCQDLNKAYTFIQQAQYCNNVLINLLAKKLQNAVVKPQNEPFKIDIHQNYKSEESLLDAVRNEFTIVGTNSTVQVEETREHKPFQLNEKKNEEIDESSQSSTGSSTSTVPTTTTTCPICQKLINGHNSLKAHMRIQHDIKVPNEYTDKQDKINTKCSQRILQRKPKEELFECSSCNYIARTYGALELHNGSIHGSEDDKFKCKFCTYSSMTKFKLFLHIKKSHKGQVKALSTDAGNKMYQSYNDSLADTEGLKTKSTIYLGNEKLNDKTSQEKEEQNDDLFIRNILNIKKRQYNAMRTNSFPRSCDECNKIFNNARALYNHKRSVHISEEQYSICPQCGKKFKSDQSMKVHVRTIHNPDLINTLKNSQTKEKNFMCSYCSYVCCNNTMLTTHVSRHHTGEKPYKCEVCSKSYVRAFDLKIHRYLHTGEKPYKCSFCSKGFRYSEHLIRHKRIHTNERPFKCQECDKSFTQRYNLTLHKRIHIKAKNLKCTVCANFFESQSALNAHRIIESHYEEVE